jgi:hypothetical protein
MICFLSIVRPPPRRIHHAGPAGAGPYAPGAGSIDDADDEA